MTHVVLENSIRCECMDCVEVCPVDCFYESETMLAIHPDECSNCGVCVPECPAEAIVPDSEPFDPVWLSINRQYASQWPNITQKKAPPADADAMNGAPNKYEEFFSPSPGAGD